MAQDADVCARDWREGLPRNPGSPRARWGEQIYRDGRLDCSKSGKGCWPKTAQRVVIELKDKAPTVMAMMDGEAQIHEDDMQQTAVIERAEPAVPATPASAATPSAQADALSALSNLGYAPGEAAAVVAQLSGEMTGADSASLIRAALKKMAPKT